MSEFRRRMMLSRSGDIPNYLCFTALEAGTFTLTIGRNIETSYYSYIEYSIDGGVTWVHTDNVSNTEVIVTTPTISAGDTVLWRGKGTKMSRNNSGYNNYCSVFSSTCAYNASGLLISLLVGKAAVDGMSISVNYTFPRLFYNDTHITDASGILIPNGAYGNSYDHFFEGCSALTKSPEFNITAFSGNASHRGLYNGCTSLVSASKLLATKLRTESYYQMFRNCASLKYIYMLATDVSATNCMYGWTYGVTNTSDGVFVKHIDAQWTTTGNNGVPSNWTIIYYDPALDKYYTDQTRSQECDDHGNPV